MLRISKIIIIILSFIFLANTGLVFAAGIVPDGNKSSCPKDYKGSNCGDYELDDFVGIAINVSNIILGIVGSLALLFFVYGGFVWILSGGNTDMVTKGKTILKNAVIGLIIVFLSWSIIFFVQTSLGSQERLDGSKAPAVEENTTTDTGN